MHRRSPGQSSLFLSQLAARRAASWVTNAVLAASFAGLNAAVGVGTEPSHCSSSEPSEGWGGTEAGRTREL